jgi:hypothetical protein
MDSRDDPPHVETSATPPDNGEEHLTRLGHGDVHNGPRPPARARLEVRPSRDAADWDVHAARPPLRSRPTDAFPIARHET